MAIILIMIVVAVLFAIIGFAVGVIFSAFKIYKWTVGDLKITPSDEGEPYLFCELDKPVSDLENDRLVVFKVRKINNDF